MRLTRRSASLSVLLIAVAIAALVFSAVRRFVPVPGSATGPPADDDRLLYEVARPSNDLAARVGPNRFSVAAVARNERDGTVRFEDGRGQPLKTPFPVTDARPREQAAWLDVADVFLNADPARLDLIELRVFDHATRRLLTYRDGTGARYQPSATPFVRLLALGGKLPASVDVWFRAASHPAGEPVVRLEGKPGSSAPMPGGSLSVREVHAGASGFSVNHAPGKTRPEYRWAPSPYETDHDCTVAFDWEGKWTGGKYQVCAVGRDGRKVFPDLPHFLDFREGVSSAAVPFKIAAENLSHFELRPFGGRDTFYFDDVRLPGPSGRPFRPAPAGSVRVDGREVIEVFTGFDPIRVTLRLRRGECCTGISSEGFLSASKPVKRLDSTFTTFLEVDGVVGPVWDLSYFDRDGKPLDVGSGGRVFSGRAGRRDGFYAFSVHDIPLERVGRVDVRLVPKP